MAKPYLLSISCLVKNANKAEGGSTQFAILPSLYDVMNDNIMSGNVDAFSDINECTSGLHNCHANADCTNIQGGLTCKCKTGYSGNGIQCSGMTSIGKMG